MKVVLSPQAQVDLEAIPPYWTGLIDVSLLLLESESLPSGVVPGIEKEIAVNVTPVKEFSKVPPRVYRLKLTDPTTKKQAVPYRILYTLDRPSNTVFVLSIPHRKDDPYDAGKAGFIQALLIEYDRYKRGRNR